jgi:hypothetical protein
MKFKESYRTQTATECSKNTLSYTFQVYMILSSETFWNRNSQCRTYFQYTCAHLFDLDSLWNSLYLAWQFIIIIEFPNTYNLVFKIWGWKCIGKPTCYMQFNILNQRNLPFTTWWLHRPMLWNSYIHPTM